jgi:uncharacterized protein
MLSESSRRFLLELARRSIAEGIAGRPAGAPVPESLPEEVRAEGACFVTLTMHGDLRGCIGSLEARQPLVADVKEHALDAALHDFRFPPVSEGELDSIHIEISVLTKPEPLAYGTPEDLLHKLRPGVDGVILSHGAKRATFLPQVWEQLPSAPAFLSQLCEKMGAEPDVWRRGHVHVFIYQVECFEE